MEDTYSTNDHDLLIELRTEIIGMREDLKTMKNDSKETISDHEARIRFIEHYMWLAIGALGLLEFGLQVWSNTK